LQERLSYVKRLEAKREVKKGAGKKDAAAELYENMCMNAVNQSIGELLSCYIVTSMQLKRTHVGRAIRHRGDWASLIFLDRRYAAMSIRNKLPKWIGTRLIVTESFGHTVKEMGAFFRSRR
jgi:chromosome transmission fidelity protein 1